MQKIRKEKKKSLVMPPREKLNQIDIKKYLQYNDDETDFNTDK